MKNQRALNIAAFAGVFTLTILTGCSSSPITENDFRIDNAREQFAQQREKKRADQPIAIKPSETPKVDRAVRVLRVLRGSGTGAVQAVSSVEIDGQLESIEAGLQRLAEQLIAESTEIEANADPAAAGVTANADSDQDSDQTLPVQILEDGYVYVSTNSVKFEPSQITNSFQKMYSQGFAKDSRGDYSASGLPLTIAIQELAKAADVDLTIVTETVANKPQVAFSDTSSAVQILDQLLVENELSVIWDPETERAWIVSTEDYSALLAYGQQNAQILSAKRESLRSSFEQRELQQLATMAQNLALDIARGQTERLAPSITQIENDFVELQPKTRLALTPQIVALRKNVNAYQGATPTQSIPEETASSESILEGEAAVESTTCLPKGEVVKVVKIFTAFLKPDEVQTQLTDNLGDLISSAATLEVSESDAEQANAISSSLGSECDAIRNLNIKTDQTGIIVTGREPQIDFITNLLDGIDTPKKQVLVEVYLVQVTADWRRQLELELSTLTTNLELSTALGSSLVNLSRSGSGAFTLSGQSSDAASAANLGNVLTFLEQNDIGRTISSPSILAIDGQPAVVNRKRTLVYPVEQPATVNTDGTTIAAATEVYEELDLNLTLEITPTVVQSNNHVILDFKLTEDAIDSEINPNTQPRTTNDITTNIETSPGDVVMLAGLYRQSTSDAVSGLPGFTGSGTIAGLTGGSSSLLKNQSELLVFIAPTVLEPGNILATQ